MPIILALERRGRDRRVNESKASLGYMTLQAV